MSWVNAVIQGVLLGGLYALYRLADRLESAPDGAGNAQVRAGEALGRVGDKISGIPH